MAWSAISGAKVRCMFVRMMSRSTSSGMVTTPSTPALPCWTQRSSLPRLDVGPVDEAERRVGVADLLQRVLRDDQLDLRHGRLQVLDPLRLPIEGSGLSSGPRAGAPVARVVASVTATGVPARKVRRFISGLVLERLGCGRNTCAILGSTSHEPSGSSLGAGSGGRRLTDVVHQPAYHASRRAGPHAVASGDRSSDGGGSRPSSNLVRSWICSRCIASSSIHCSSLSMSIFRCSARISSSAFRFTS